MGLGHILSVAAPVVGGIFGGPEGAAIGGAVGKAFNDSRSASDAAEAQQQQANNAIALQQQEFQQLQKLQQPYVNAGTGALSAEQDLLGLNGPAAETTAFNSLANGPQMQAYIQQGENALRANASATGGLRGGNLEAALAQFRPQWLSQLIDQQYGRLAGLTSLGQNAAAGVGNAGIQTGNTISNQYGQIGAAQAGNAMAQGKAFSNLGSGIVNAYGQQQAQDNFDKLVGAMSGGAF